MRGEKEDERKEKDVGGWKRKIGKQERKGEEVEERKNVVRYFIKSNLVLIYYLGCKI